jgi:hypothetical protein
MIMFGFPYPFMHACALLQLESVCHCGKKVVHVHLGLSMATVNRMWSFVIGIDAKRLLELPCPCIKERMDFT